VLEIKQTDTYRKWERKLRDQRGKALIAARIYFGWPMGWQGM